MSPFRERRSDPDDFDRFVASVAPDLLRTAYFVAWDTGAAEDLVQEGLFRVARRWPRVRSMEYPAAYARRIVLNLALSTAEKRERQRAELAHRPAAGSDADPAAVRALEAIDTLVDLVVLLGSLPARQRAVLALRYFDDLSETQVAELLGCSIGTVKSTASRALGRLRSEIAVPPAPVAAPGHSESRHVNGTHLILDGQDTRS